MRYFDKLPDLLYALNHRFHRSIGRTPASVNRKNEKEVFDFQYGEYLGEKKRKQKYNMGDIVRVSKQKTAFKKGYLKNFTDEKFRIVDLLDTIPTTYRIVADSSNEIIKGTWYESELCQIKDIY